MLDQSRMSEGPAKCRTARVRNGGRWIAEDMVGRDRLFRASHVEPRKVTFSARGGEGSGLLELCQGLVEMHWRAISPGKKKTQQPVFPQGLWGSPFLSPFHTQHLLRYTLCQVG